MTGILIRLFVKDHKNISDPRVRRRYGAFAGLAGIVSNLLLFAVKITVGTLFNSIAVTADAVNNLTDCGSSLVALLGFRLSGKPADARHPFGHARIEHISGLIISLIVIILGGQLVYSSVLKIIAPEEVQFSYVLVFALVVSILLKLWQARFYKHIGKKIQSATLVAAGTDSRNDVLFHGSSPGGSAFVPGDRNQSGRVPGCNCCRFHRHFRPEAGQRNQRPLLGTAPDKELVDAIYAKILSYEGILGIHDLAVHNYGGGNIFASVHCEVPSSQDVMVSHEIIDGIERDVKERPGHRPGGAHGPR